MPAAATRGRRPPRSLRNTQERFASLEASVEMIAATVFAAAEGMSASSGTKITTESSVDAPPTTTNRIIGHACSRATDTVRAAAAATAPTGTVKARERVIASARTSRAHPTTASSQ